MPSVPVFLRTMRLPSHMCALRRRYAASPTQFPYGLLQIHTWVLPDVRHLFFPSLGCPSGVGHHAAGPMLPTTEARPIFTSGASLPCTITAMDKIGRGSLFEGLLCRVWNVPDMSRPPPMWAQAACDQPTCTWHKRGIPSSHSRLQPRQYHMSVLHQTVAS